jgi:TonB family protein
MSRIPGNLSLQRQLVIACLCLAATSWAFAPQEPPAEPGSASSPSAAGEIPRWRFRDDVTVSESDKVEPPVLILRVGPVYTKPVATAKPHERIGLELEVNEQGSVVHAVVTRPLEPGLDADAVAAAMKWKYTPARLNGVTRPCLAKAILFYSYRPPGPAPASWRESRRDGSITWINDRWGFQGDVELAPGDQVKGPSVLEKAPVRYSESARKKRIRGVVGLELLIDAEGRVTDAKVTQRLEASMDENAVNTVLQWRFSPASLNGVAKPSIYKMTMNFQIAEASPAVDRRIRET